jgi:hypothetical protein
LRAVGIESAAARAWLPALMIKIRLQWVTQTKFWMPQPVSASIRCCLTKLSCVVVVAVAETVRTTTSRRARR